MDFNTFVENFDAIAEAPGGIPKLRSLILDLAVRGKLVPQNPEDEPAQVFLKRALEARKDWYATACRLAEVNGSKKPRKPCLLMPQVLLTDYPGSVPRTWTFCFFENLAAAKEYAIKAGPFGSALKKQDYTERGYKIYGQEQVIKNDALFGDYYIGEKKYQQLKSCSVEPGDLLISLVGTIGKTLTLVEGCEPGIINPRLVKFSLHSEINRRFIQIFLRSPQAMHLMKENAHGGTMDILNLKILSDLPIALPPLAEQNRIVEKVDELMALCDRYEATQQTRDNLREKLRGSTIASLMNLVCQQSEDEPAHKIFKEIQESKQLLYSNKKATKKKECLPFNDNETPFSIPKTWKWVRLHELCWLISDGTHHTPTYVESGVPFLSVKNVSGGCLDFSNTRFITREAHEELCVRCKPEYGDILLTKVGTTGIAVEIDTHQEFSIFVSIALLKHFPEFTYPRFLQYLLNSSFVKAQSEAGTEGVGNKNLVLRKIYNFIVPLPPLAEQKRLVAKVDELMKLCDQLEASLRESQQRAESLAASAISHLTI